MRRSVIGLALMAAPVAAQDLQPALDPVMLGQGLTLSSAMRAQANRDARRLGYRDVDDYRTAKTCASARNMARPTGRRGQMMDRLRALCRQAGR